MEEVLKYGKQYWDRIMWFNNYLEKRKETVIYYAKVILEGSRRKTYKEDNSKIIKYT